jgi:hypothetical protein
MQHCAGVMGYVVEVVFSRCHVTGSVVVTSLALQPVIHCCELAAGGPTSSCHFTCRTAYLSLHEPGVCRVLRLTGCCARCLAVLPLLLCLLLLLLFSLEPPAADGVSGAAGPAASTGAGGSGSAENFAKAAAAATLTAAILSYLASSSTCRQCRSESPQLPSLGSVASNEVGYRCTDCDESSEYIGRVHLG